jgi:hypothetical protein
MIARWESFAADLKVVGQTEPTPGLPYIAALGSDTGRMFGIISAAIAALSPEDRDALRLRGLVRIAPETYLAVPTPPTPESLGLAPDA